MHIYIAIKKFYQLGGMERYFRDIVNYLYSQNINIGVYSNKFDDLLPESSKINQHYFFNSKILSKLSFLNRNTFLRKIARLNHISPIIAPSKLVSDITICGGTHLGYVKSMNQPNLSFHDKSQIKEEKDSFKYSKIIIAHHDQMAKELIDLYDISENKIKILYPPINNNFKVFSLEERILFRKNYNFKKDEIYLLFPSSGHKRKGLDLILKALESVNNPKVKLVVVGKTLPNEYKKYRNIIELGYCHEMGKLYAASDFTILASIYEPFGLVLIESILSGTPVIASVNIGATSLLSNQVCHKFTPNDLDSLIETIKYSINLIKENKFKNITSPKEHILYNYSIKYHMDQLISMAKSI
ncbi:MAG: glycosyltransferase family 4 protein [Psittacicella sp.]